MLLFHCSQNTYLNLAKIISMSEGHRVTQNLYAKSGFSEIEDGGDRRCGIKRIAVDLKWMINLIFAKLNGEMQNNISQMFDVKEWTVLNIESDGRELMTYLFNAA